MTVKMSCEDLKERIGNLEDEALKRDEMESALRKSEERFRTLTTLAPVGIFMTDAAGHCLFVNERCCEIVGLSPEEAMGDGWIKALHPADRERVVREWYQRAGAGMPFEMEYRFKTPEGRVTWVNGCARAVHDSRGKVIEYIGTISDITERKRNEARLQASEKHLRAILDSVLDGIITIDENGIIETFNRAAEQIFGYPAEEVIGRNVKILMLEPHRSRHDDYIKDYIKTGEAKIIGIGREVPGLRKNGEAFPMDLAVNEMWEKGRRKFIGAVRDITKRREAEDALKESERQLSTLIGNLQGMAYRCLNDEDRTMKFVSEGCEQLTGYPPEVLIDSRGVSYNDLIHPADRNFIRETVQAALAEKKPYHIQYRIRTASGEEKWVDERGVGVFSVQGDLQVLEGLVTDISDLVRTQDALRELNLQLEKRVAARTAELQQANEALEASLAHLKQTQEHLVQSEKMAALGELVAGVAHEINTPVGIGVTAASHLEQKTKELEAMFADRKMKRADFEKYLNLALESTASMLTNLNRAADLIKSFKQVAVDQASEERRWFRLKEYIEKVLLSLRPKYKRTRHTLTVNCPEDLQICSYPGAFSQIITNLVINSLIHGFENIEEGNIVLDVTVADNQLLLDYRDDGSGMDSAQVKKIFDPFFTSKRVPESTGLGMHIVYNLVTRLLNGRIECRSAPDQGAEFMIQIPIGEEHADG